jgi:hypothetical protein
VQGENGGISGYSSAITIIRDDLAAEITRLTKQKAVFGIVEYLSLVPLFGVSPIESFLMSTMPGTAMVYNGLLGSVMRVLLLAVCIGSYFVISHINSPRVVKTDDRNAWARRLLRFDSWRAFVRGLEPKKPQSRAKVASKLRTALSRQDLPHLYTKKAVFAAVFCMAALAVLAGVVSIGRDYARTTTAELSLVGGAERTEKQLQAMRKIDEIYFAAEGVMIDYDVEALIRSHMRDITALELADEMNRVRNKYEMYTSINFYWWFVPLAVAVGALGWFFPNLIIRQRAKLVKTQTEEDFMELQTLTAALTFTGADTLSVLEQLARNSTAHRDWLNEAYHNYSANPELELERLKSRVTLPDFRGYIDKLKLTISDLPLEDAFRSLLAERQKLAADREIAAEAALRSRRTFCGFLVTASLGLFLVAELLLPVGLLGVREFTKMSSILETL